MSMTKSYDVIVIGSGTAGQTAAYKLHEKGLHVGVVESSTEPGGTCALAGCQAKKWFFEAMETVARSRHLSGIGVSQPAAADWGALRDAKNRFTSRVPSHTVTGLKEAGIDYIEGRARFTDDQTLQVGDRQLSSKFILIATGAVPMPLPIDGADQMIRSSQFMELPELPRRILFVGGGFISFEFSHFAARIGAADTRCVILEAAGRPLGAFDEEMVNLLTAASEAEGIEIHCNTTITTIEKRDSRFIVSTKEGQHFETDLVVHGAGRIPDLKDLDLDKAGIRYTSRGISVDQKMITTNPHVYAIGDCAATIQLARVADCEAGVAAADIIGRVNSQPSSRTMNYTAVPAVLFTYPQIAMVGSTEKTLKDQNTAYRKSFGKDLKWNTYRRIGMKSAAYKLLVGEDDQLLGAHILSDNATGMIALFAQAMTNRIPVTELYQQSIMTPYPSRESDILYMLASFEN